ncbi:unnamed protein product [Rotaria sp. Silwood1]|nr:unnamed protein product [Rotaria sp. Silwood1]CAF1571771.1 unnamed protein product [Rotaria sp. Silwood1]
MWLNKTTSPDEEEEPMIYSEEIQITKGMAESDALNTNVLLEEDATSEAESVIEDSSDEENISSEEQEQQQAQEKLNDIVDEQIFEDTITNDTPPGKIVFGMHLLLCRIRCLIILIRKCYLINEYVRRQAKADKTIQSGELVLDFHIRWNTTCVMLTKFIEHRRIIVDITNTPGKITNLKRSKCDCLMSLTLCSQRWEWIIILKKILDPFQSATHALSARNYATIAPGKVIVFELKNFLSTRNVYHHLENILKSQLLKKYTLYFEVKVTEEQSRLALIAAFLCPYAKQYLTVSDLKKAETILIQEYNEILRSEKLISSATTNNITVSSSNAEQSMESSIGHMEKSIDYLLKICLAEKPPVHQTTNKRTIWAIQQELGYYATRETPKRNFQSYWNLNQDKMPILASLVPRFCL